VKKSKEFKNIMARIEIVNKDNELEVVFFQIPKCVTKYWETNLIKDLRKETIYKVKRDNPEDKVILLY
jgi:hypothetical protein